MSESDEIVEFPADWRRAVVVVAHPDDPEYGMSAAVARWTSEGREVVYLLASSGEAGIEGMHPDECGPLREQEQIRSSEIVGVTTVEFLGFPDGNIENSPELRAEIRRRLEVHEPDVLIGLFSGAEFAPGFPNQRDHMECGAALVDVHSEMDAGSRPPLFESAFGATHYVEVEDFVEAAVDALSEHAEYLRVLDPETPVEEQARAQVERVTAPRDGVAGGRPVVGFRHMAD